MFKIAILRNLFDFALIQMALKSSRASLVRLSQTTRSYGGKREGVGGNL